MKIENWIQAESLQGAYQALLDYPHATVIGGGMYLRLQNRTIPYVIDLSKLQCHGIDKTLCNGIVTLKIGAMTTLREIECGDPGLPRALTQAVRQIGGVSLRNMATLGGSVMGRYPFSDIITALVALDAKLLFFKRGPVSLEDYLKETHPKPDILHTLEIQCEEGGSRERHSFFSAFKPVYTDFSLVNVACCLRGTQLRIGIGARPGVAKVVVDTLDQDGQGGLEGIIDRALQVCDFGSDYRASADYRRALAKTLLEDGLVGGWHVD